MKHRWLVGILSSVLLVGPSVLAQGQTPASGTVPTGETALGSVTIPRAVRADGKPLAAGTYQVRLTAQTAQPPAPGLDPALERWVEFLSGGKVVGREVVSIVPAGDVSQLQPGPDLPGRQPSGARVDMLKGNEYLRVWINRGGVNYLIHLPTSA
jgi:hypothetical protein